MIEFVETEEPVSDVEIASVLMGLLKERGFGKTICPSEVARKISQQELIWRSLMPRVKKVAIALAEGGVILVSQKGRRVDLRQTRGPVRLSLMRP